MVYICQGGQANDGFLPTHHLRNVVGFELKESYHTQALRNLTKAAALRKERDKERYPLLAGIA
jgi:hypothetical protein